jgi:hypothetical protein
VTCTERLEGSEAEGEGSGWAEVGVEGCGRGVSVCVFTVVCMCACVCVRARVFREVWTMGGDEIFNMGGRKWLRLDIETSDRLACLHGQR